MKREFIPADATIADLKKQAADCEEQAARAAEPLASELREKAKQLQAWIQSLHSGRWTAVVPKTDDK
jgi:hypothetical protein